MGIAPPDRIKYFMPEWDDRYDLEFDFINDKFSEVHKKNTNSDVYAHEMLARPPYDGILYSLGNIFDTINNASDLSAVKARGFSKIKDYYNMQKAQVPLEVFGDCGAFNYVNLPEPPARFTPENIAFLYNHLGFDYGVSVDHLVVETIIEKTQQQKETKALTLPQKRKRIKLSLENASKHLEICKREKYAFTPVGSAQGYSPRSYRNSVASLIEMGFEYIALGGLVRRDTDSILAILKSVKPVVGDRRLHLLGVIRSQCISEWRKLGVTSIDSASYFRKAWLRSDQNYISPDGSKWYAALRVPIVKESGMLVKDGHTFNLAQLEADCLKALREYDKGLLDMESTLDLLIEYDSLFLRSGDDGTNLRDKYRKTLQDKPWKVCECPVCKQLGIEVVIFRRTNRNKRRGLHNTWVVYQQLIDD
ncbi:MAG TPA: tRNA-guanine transglycosylase DpdA [Syntrophomonadaceae bacterium]|nr:tRNA-guanine transglycosylase DpdA [Syntrophomonadaceae bacterium]